MQPNYQDAEHGGGSYAPGEILDQETLSQASESNPELQHLMSKTTREDDVMLRPTGISASYINLSKKASQEDVHTTQDEQNQPSGLSPRQTDPIERQSASTDALQQLENQIKHEEDEQRAL